MHNKQPQQYNNSGHDTIVTRELIGSTPGIFNRVESQEQRTITKQELRQCTNGICQVTWKPIPRH